MTMMLRGVVLVAAVVFIAISASMNALFLSSFGRSVIETSLLAGVSIAGDVVKAVLPVVLLRAVLHRLWGQAALSAIMLAVVVAMSLASGLGFAALTRSGSAVSHQGRDAALHARTADLTEVDVKLSALPAARPRALIEADLATAQLDRAWKQSKACSEVAGPVTRDFCTRVIALRSELATTGQRDALETERRSIRAAIATLRAGGAGSEADPQAAALADLFGTDRVSARALMTSALAIVLELGSLVLILLAAGPALREEKPPISEPERKRVPITVPASADRTYWHRLRGGEAVSANKEGGP